MRGLTLFLLPIAAFGLSGCLAKTAFDVATAPVRVASKAVDLATTSQSEADEKRGRELRKEEERRGREARQAAERCRKGRPLPTDDCTAASPRCEECPLAGPACTWYTAGRPPAPEGSRRVQAFEGTDRQLRGLIMALLRENDTAEEQELLALDAEDPVRVRRCAASLVADGLAAADGTGLRLP